jgi:hypothetical protein
MNEPEIPWSDLPPTPPDVPDQRPRTSDHGAPDARTSRRNRARSAGDIIPRLLAGAIVIATLAFLDDGDGSTSATTGSESALEELRVERDPVPRSSDGWRGWRGSDGSFSFDFPTGTEPREPEVEDGSWQLASRGNALHMYISVFEGYRIGSDPLAFLDEIADGFAEDRAELRRSLVLRQDATGLDIVYRDAREGYLWYIRLWTADGLLYQVSAGYPELLHGRELRARAETFLDSFRIAGDPVAEPS